MPLKLNVAISRKIGQPNYGSRGATVGLEMEVDSSLARNSRQLHDKIAALFKMARQSVERELVSRTSEDEEHRAATPAQVRAIRAIAKRKNLDLLAELSSRFGITHPEHLSLEEASRFIDAVASSQNGAPYRA